MAFCGTKRHRPPPTAAHLPGARRQSTATHRLFTRPAYRNRRASTARQDRQTAVTEPIAPPAVSVALSVYNGARFLAEAIDSVLAQHFGDFEFLILDDGSTDATPDMIRAAAARDPRIRPIIRENRGLVASLNQLLAEARLGAAE